MLAASVVPGGAHVIPPARLMCCVRRPGKTDPRAFRLISLKRLLRLHQQKCRQTPDQIVVSAAWCREEGGLWDILIRVSDIDPLLKHEQYIGCPFVEVILPLYCSESQQIRLSEGFCTTLLRKEECPHLAWWENESIGSCWARLFFGVNGGEISLMLASQVSINSSTIADSQMQDATVVRRNRALCLHGCLSCAGLMSLLRQPQKILKTGWPITRGRYVELPLVNGQSPNCAITQPHMPKIILRYPTPEHFTLPTYYGTAESYS